MPAKLRLVKPAPRRATEPLQCPTCKGREVIETRVGVTIVNGKATGGTRVLCCAQCHRRGDRVPLA